tara:strand:+ start:142 stop:252 length:111 start_codon:yes stop_codon:yes gene_type:complete
MYLPMNPDPPKTTAIGEFDLKIGFILSLFLTFNLDT